MGVLGDVISVGPNGPSVGASSKRWLGEGPDGPSLGTYLVVIIYMHYIYILLVYMWECG